MIVLMGLAVNGLKSFYGVIRRNCREVECTGRAATPARAIRMCCVVPLAEPMELLGFDGRENRYQLCVQ
jgi:hypothetical protein